MDSAKATTKQEHDMTRLLIDFLCDFCRWRARRNADRAKRALVRSHLWCRRESAIIKRTMESR